MTVEQEVEFGKPKRGTQTQEFRINRLLLKGHEGLRVCDTGELK